MLRGRGWGPGWRGVVPASARRRLSSPAPGPVSTTASCRRHTSPSHWSGPGPRPALAMRSVLIFVFITLSFTVGTFAPPFALFRCVYVETNNYLKSRIFLGICYPTPLVKCLIFRFYFFVSTNLFS